MPQGAIAQVRAAVPASTASLTWARGFWRLLGAGRTGPPRILTPVTGLVPDPRLLAGGRPFLSAPRDTLQTLPSAGHGHHRRRFSGWIPRAGG